ncbi:MAG: hypothetical protein ACI9LM_004878, partial [Alteromonadaceae bacterium]
AIGSGISDMFLKKIYRYKRMYYSNYFTLAKNHPNYCR